MTLNPMKWWVIALVQYGPAAGVLVAGMEFAGVIALAWAAEAIHARIAR